MPPTVYATHYVTPLREGGSLPAIVEASDLGFYVLKFRGAGQGPLALVAELIAAEIGRALGLKIPDLVLMEVDAALGRNEPDPEIRDLLNVDRTPRNANLLWWHKVLYLIDQGAGLYFHHNWQNAEQMATSRFPAIRDHILLPWTSRIEEADRRLRPRLDEALFARAIDQIPDAWLPVEPGLSPAEESRVSPAEVLVQLDSEGGHRSGTISSSRVNAAA